MDVGRVEKRGTSLEEEGSREKIYRETAKVKGHLKGTMGNYYSRIFLKYIHV